MGQDFKIDGDIGTGELSPGSTSRRYLPEKGLRKHREKIHSDSKRADNLQFSFSKPKKAKTIILVKCGKCGAVASVGKNTVGMICRECHSYAPVVGVEENER